MGSSIGPKMTTSDAVFLIDAGNPRSYAGEGTTNVTCIISGHQGSRVNGTGYSTVNGGSFFFGAGGASTVQYILFNDNASINPAGDCTICYWFREAVAVSSYTLIQRYAAGSSTTGFYNYVSTAGANKTVTLVKYDGSTGLSETRGNITTAVAGSWNYICFFPTRATNTSYINGAQSNPVYNPSTTFPSIATTFPFYVGASLASTKIMNISQVQFFNRILSATEVLQNYNAQKARYGR